MSREDMLREAIHGATDAVYMTNKADIVEFYRENYGKNWTAQAARDLSGAEKGSKEYKSAQRHFQGDRLEKEPKTKAGAAKAAERWQTLGQKLPPIGRKLKEGKQEIKISVAGTQGIYKDGKQTGERKRNIEVTFSGANAQEFINNPTFSDIWSAYDVDPELFEDGDYAIEVSGVTAA